MCPYSYDSEKKTLICAGCGGTGNAVTSPFIDSILGYIPAHAHKHKCPRAHRMLLAEIQEQKRKGKP